MHLLAYVYTIQMGKNEIKWAVAFRDYLEQHVDARNVSDRKLNYIVQFCFLCTAICKCLSFEFYVTSE